MSEHTTLYRLFDARHRLLYVGISSRGPARWKEHSKERPWWQDVQYSSMEHFESRSDAEAAERFAIANEKPKWNVVHNDRSDPVKMSMRFYCSFCNRRSLIGGHFAVDASAAVAMRQFDDDVYRQKLREADTAGRPFILYSGNDILNGGGGQPKPEWVVSCREPACDVNTDGFDYFITLKQIEAVHDFLLFIEHVMHKNWFQYTDLGLWKKPQYRCFQFPGESWTRKVKGEAA